MSDSEIEPISSCQQPTSTGRCYKKKKRCCKTGNALEAANNMNILCLWNLFFPQLKKEGQVHRFQSRL